MTPAAQPGYPGAAIVRAGALAGGVPVRRAAGQHPALPADFSSTGIGRGATATEAALPRPHFFQSKAA